MKKKEKYFYLSLLFLMFGSFMGAYYVAKAASITITRWDSDSYDVGYWASNPHRERIECRACLCTN